MALRFDGSVVLVTGAGRGIGRAHALDFARRGAKVLVNDTGGDVHGHGRDESVADAVCAEISAAGGTALPSCHDVSSYEDGYALVKTAMDAWGRVDAIVCNAGILRDMAFHNIGERDWDDVVATHLKGCYNVLHAVWPVFRQQRYGRVVLTTSISGLYGNFGQANYGAAKAGMVGLMNVLKLEGEKYNVGVNVVSPGAFTRMGGTVPERGDAAAISGKAIYRSEHVTPAVVYLASPACTDSGLIIHAQGGMFYRIAMVRNEGVPEAPDADRDAEWVAAHWDEITRLDALAPMWNISETRDEHLGSRDAASATAEVPSR